MQDWGPVSTTFTTESEASGTLARRISAYTSQHGSTKARPLINVEALREACNTGMISTEEI